jgi:hypothetical protein
MFCYIIAWKNVNFATLAQPKQLAAKSINSGRSPAELRY